MSDYADTEKSGIRFELSAWHTFHTKVDLQVFDTILRDFTAVSIPNQGSLGQFGSVACNNVPGLVIEQSSLVFVFDHNQAERLDHYIKISAGRRNVALTEFIMNHHACLGQVTNHRHIALFSLAGKAGRLSSRLRFAKHHHPAYGR